MLLSLNRFVFKIKMPPVVRVQLINDLADIEYVPMSYSLFHLLIVFFILNYTSVLQYCNGYTCSQYNE